MKKVSTAAAKQSRNISQQRLTIGLDLGDRNSCYCVLDEAGRVQLEQRVRTTAHGAGQRGARTGEVVRRTLASSPGFSYLRLARGLSGPLVILD